MRFDRKKLSHLLFLFIAGVNTAFGAAIRKLGLANKNNTIIFFGHTHNGNLKSFYDYLEKNGPYKPYYLTIFPQYKKKLISQGVRALTASNFMDSLKLSRARAVISDHGAPVVFPLYKQTDMKFVDVWHGIPYKGWDENSFGEQKHYDEIWVSSSAFVEIYKEKYGFNNTVVATGYSRTDPLVNGEYSKEDLIERYDLPKATNRIILMAPTWKQDKQNRSIIPFGENIESFFIKLNDIGKKNNALVIFRAHLNSGDQIEASRLSHVRIMPYANFPVAEEFLGGADLLVTDWSSIAFDFLVTNKPVVYLGVDPPFEKGFTLDGSYRFGPVVDSLTQLEETVSTYLERPDTYSRDYKSVIKKSSKIAYGGLADGKASQRYFERLQNLLSK